MNSTTPTKQSTIGLTRQNLESEGHLNTLEKGGGFLDTTFKITGYRKRRLSKLPAPVIIPTPPIIISCSPVSSEQNSPKTPQSPTKRYILKPITALTAAFQRTSITGRKSSSPMTLLKFPKSQSNNNQKSPKPTSSPQSPKPPKSPKLLHRKGSSGSIRKRSESPTNSTAATAVAASYLNSNISSQSPTNNSKNSFRFCKSIPSNNLNQSSTLPKSPSKLGKFNLKHQKSNTNCKKALPIIPSELAERLRESFSFSAKFEEENFHHHHHHHYYYDENNGSIIKPIFNRLPKPILIDVRNLSLYQDEHIRDSFNVNLPTLLIKRYRRGNMSNFSLDSFITTPEDRDKYLDLINEDGGKYHHDIIVFDDNMDENDKVSPGWTLLSVLERVMLSYHSNSSESIDEINDMPRGRVYWLKGGFEAFRSWDQRGEFIVTDTSSSISDKDKSDDSTLMEYEGQDQQGSNLVRRDSLFSVNTERSSLRRKKSVKQSGPNCPNLEINSQLPPPPSSPPSPPSQQQQQQSQPQQQMQQQQQKPQHQRQHSPPQLQLQPPIPSETKQEVPRGRRPSNGLQYLFTPTGNSNGKIGETLSLYPNASYGVHDFPNDDLLPDTPPPVTHPEIAFEVSTIIPGFLFLGPEITKDEEVKELEDKGIRRILNMAFECEDTLRLKEKFDRYLKLNIKDSVEEDIEKGLKFAVNFIERAQEDNAPIYVHCRAGKSRSVTAVLAYLIKSHHWTLKHAYDYVMERRNSISPNIGFVAELMRVEEDVLGFKRNGGAVTETPNRRKEEIMDMEGVEPLGKSPKTAFF